MLQALRKNVAWWAIPIAGVSGGIAFLIANAILAPAVLEVSPWLVLRYSASLVGGEGMVSDPDAAYFVLGLVVHLVLSVVFATVIALIVHRGGLLLGVVGGAILGLCLYSLNLYTLTLIFEWYFAVNSVVLAINHLVFGLVVGVVYETLDHFDLPLKKVVPHAA